MYQPKLKVIFECIPLQHYSQNLSIPLAYTIDRQWTFTSNNKTIIAEADFDSHFVKEMVWMLHYQRYGELYGCFQSEASRLLQLPGYCDSKNGLKLVAKASWWKRTKTYVLNFGRRNASEPKNLI